MQLSMTTGSGTTTLTYDFEGRVTGITYPNTSTNSFTYNGLDSRVGAVDSQGTKTFRRDGVSVTAPLLADGLANYTPGISERRSGTTKFLHSGLKNKSAQTISNQTVAGTKSYDAFGNVLASTGSWSGNSGYGGNFGYQTDPDSGLKLLGHRYYDSSIGRFLTRDPAKDGRNWYSYCENNPVSMADPDGQIIWFIAAGILIWRAYDAVTTVHDIWTDPTDIWSWIGFIPGGKVVKNVAKVANKVSDGHRAGKALQGAKSLPNWLEHLRKWEAARQQLKELKRKLTKAKGKKVQEAIKKETGKLEKQIGGHEKEMGQLW